MGDAEGTPLQRAQRLADSLDLLDALPAGADASVGTVIFQDYGFQASGVTVGEETKLYISKDTIFDLLDILPDNEVTNVIITKLRTLLANTPARAPEPVVIALDKPFNSAILVPGSTNMAVRTVRYGYNLKGAWKRVDDDTPAEEKVCGYYLAAMVAAQIPGLSNILLAYCTSENKDPYMKQGQFATGREVVSSLTVSALHFDVFLGLAAMGKNISPEASNFNAWLTKRYQTFRGVLRLSRDVNPTRYTDMQALSKMYSVSPKIKDLLLEWVSKDASKIPGLSPEASAVHSQAKMVLSWADMKMCKACIDFIYAADTKAHIIPLIAQESQKLVTEMNAVEEANKGIPREFLKLKLGNIETLEMAKYPNVVYATLCYNRNKTETWANFVSKVSPTLDKQHIETELKKTVRRTVTTAMAASTKQFLEDLGIDVEAEQESARPRDPMKDFQTMMETFLNAQNRAREPVAPATASTSN